MCCVNKDWWLNRPQQSGGRLLEGHTPWERLNKICQTFGAMGQQAPPTSLRRLIGQFKLELLFISLCNFGCLEPVALPVCSASSQTQWMDVVGGASDTCSGGRCCPSTSAPPAGSSSQKRRLWSETSSRWTPTRPRPSGWPRCSRRCPGCSGGSCGGGGDTVSSRSPQLVTERTAMRLRIKQELRKRWRKLDWQLRRRTTALSQLRLPSAKTNKDLPARTTNASELESKWKIWLNWQKILHLQWLHVNINKAAVCQRASTRRSSRMTSSAAEKQKHFHTVTQMLK